jgi:predicted ATP-grasp superfamily ATP-dependent carboligase
VACADHATARIFLEKTETNDLARRIGVAVPTTVIPKSIEDLTAPIAQFPAIIKPSLGHRYYEVFGRKWTRVHDINEARIEYTAAKNAGLEVLLQEFIPGDELCGANYNSYFWAGSARMEFTARKIRNSPPDSGSPSVVRSEYIPEVVEAGRAILKAVDYHGFSCIEFKRDVRDGAYKLIEVNARHNLSAMLAIRCGVNFPLAQYRHLIHGEMPTQQPYHEGIYWIDITRDIKDAVHYLRRPDYTIRRFLQPYLKPHAFAVWSLNDPRPSITRGVDTIRALSGRRSAS